MGISDNISKDCALKSKNDGVCQVTSKLQNMSTGGADVVVSVCANCGKEGNDVNNICNKCKMVKYCNAACKKKHRHKHKKECEVHCIHAAERAAKLRDKELRLAAEKHDEELFKQPPPKEDCPICFQRIPTLGTGCRYYECCGKEICSGCVYAPVYDDQGNKVDDKKCVFCRTPASTSEKEVIERKMKRAEKDDPAAMFNLACNYEKGRDGYRQDYTRALELYHRAGDLGYAQAYLSIGYAYKHGRGVEVDKKKANHYYELGAMGGSEGARHNLGLYEANAGNIERAIKHYMIAVRSGHVGSLNKIQKLYSKGHATKDEYTEALRFYQSYLEEIKSSQRDEAAAASEFYRYD